MYAISVCLDEPEIHYQPIQLAIVQNNSVTIPCEITTDEVTVDYFWLFNDIQLNLSSPRYMMEVGTGNITIVNVQAEDEGIYECLANLSRSDSMADDLRYSIGSEMISVVCKLTVCPRSRHVPKFYLEMITKFVVYSNSHQLSCFLSQYITYSLFVMCLIVIPGSVDMPQVNETRSRDVVIVWAAVLSDGGSNITTRYIIEQRLVSLYGSSIAQDDATWMNVSSSDSLMSRVTSLDPYTGYQFRVIAVNIAGNGRPSVPSMVTITLEDGRV